jgi:UPF0755 protein
MSDGGWYGYPPQEPDPYSQPQDDRYRSDTPEYGDSPQATGYDQYGRQNQADPQYQQYYQQQQPHLAQQQPQQPQAQNPYFQQQQQPQQQDYGYDSGTYSGGQQQYPAGRPQPQAGYEGYAQPGYDTGGYPQQDYERSGYDTSANYSGQGYDSAASYDAASYPSGSYNTSGAYNSGSYDTGSRDPYADLGGLAAEEPDEYEYPGRSSRRRRANPTGEQPQVAEDGRFGLLGDEQVAESPSAPGRGEGDEEEEGGRKRSRSGSKQKGKKGGSRRSCMVIFLFFALLAGGLGYGGYQGYKWYESHYGPPADYSSSTGDSATAIVTIPAGSGGDDIAEILYTDGVVESERAFIDACDANAQCANIQANTYQLHKQMSAASAVTALLNTSNVYNKSQLLVRPGERASAVFTDLEQKTGWTQAQIVSAINGGQIDLPSYAAAKPGTKYPFANIEGLLFTGTYQLPTYKTPTALLKAMVDQQLAMFNAIGLTSKASSLGMTPYQVLTVASMARAEAGSNAADLNKIAGIIYTRLKSSQYDKLGFDTATLYGLGRTEPQPTTAELEDTSNPYNLRVIAGLPPGPIDSVDQTALSAALDPTDSTDVYFCAVNGTIHYAANDTEWAALGTQYPGYCG